MARKDIELTEYDFDRTTHTTITDDVTVSLSTKTFDEFLCPICLSLLKNTLTTMECLHRFCGECITSALRYGNKECPTCRKPCPSRRSLRPDLEFDAIIALIFPSFDVYEQQQQERFAKIQQLANPNSFVRNVQEGLRHQVRGAARARAGFLHNIVCARQAESRSRVVSKRAALESVMPSQLVKVHKASVPRRKVPLPPPLPSIVPVENTLYVLLEPSPSTPLLLRHCHLRVPPSCTPQHFMRLLQLQPAHVPGSRYVIALAPIATRGDVIDDGTVDGVALDSAVALSDLLAVRATLPFATPAAVTSAPHVHLTYRCIAPSPPPPSPPPSLV